MSFNKITMVGNLGRDPEFRRLPSGAAVCNFSVAVNETSRGDGGRFRSTPTWFRISAWGERAANTARNLRKGSPVYVAGRLKPKEWKDKEGGSHFILEVRATDIRAFGTPSSRGVRVT